MKLVTKIVVGVVLVLAAGGVLLVNGVFARSSAAHPPCDELPTVAEAAAALAENQDFADEIRALGEGITVEAHNPCSEEEDRGLIRVTYGSTSEREAIDNVIVSRDGFGVPLYVVKR